MAEKSLKTILPHFPFVKPLCGIIEHVLESDCTDSFDLFVRIDNHLNRTTPFDLSSGESNISLNLYYRMGIKLLENYRENLLAGKKKSEADTKEEYLHQKNILFILKSFETHCNILFITNSTMEAQHMEEDIIAETMSLAKLAESDEIIYQALITISAIIILNPNNETKTLTNFESSFNTLITADLKKEYSYLSKNMAFKNDDKGTLGSLLGDTASPNTSENLYDQESFSLVLLKKFLMKLLANTLFGNISGRWDFGFETLYSLVLEYPETLPTYQPTIFYCFALGKKVTIFKNDRHIISSKAIESLMSLQEETAFATENIVSNFKSNYIFAWSFTKCQYITKADKNLDKTDKEKENFEQTLQDNLVKILEKTKLPLSKEKLSISSLGETELLILLVFLKTEFSIAFEFLQKEFSLNLEDLIPYLFLPPEETKQAFNILLTALLEAYLGDVKKYLRGKGATVITVSGVLNSWLSQVISAAASAISAAASAFSSHDSENKSKALINIYALRLKCLCDAISKNSKVSDTFSLPSNSIESLSLIVDSLSSTLVVFPHSKLLHDLWMQSRGQEKLEKLEVCIFFNSLLESDSKSIYVGGMGPSELENLDIMLNRIVESAGVITDRLQSIESLEKFNNNYPIGAYYPIKSFLNEIQMIARASLLKKLINYACKCIIASRKLVDQTEAGPESRINIFERQSKIFKVVLKLMENFIYPSYSDISEDSLDDLLIDVISVLIENASKTYEFFPFETLISIMKVEKWEFNQMNFFSFWVSILNKLKKLFPDLKHEIDLKSYDFNLLFLENYNINKQKELTLQMIITIGERNYINDLLKSISEKIKSVLDGDSPIKGTFLDSRLKLILNILKCSCESIDILIVLETLASVTKNFDCLQNEDREIIREFFNTAKPQIRVQIIRHMIRQPTGFSDFVEKALIFFASSLKISDTSNLTEFNDFLEEFKSLYEELRKSGSSSLLERLKYFVIKLIPIFCLMGQSLSMDEHKTKFDKVKTILALLYENVGEKKSDELNHLLNEVLGILACKISNSIHETVLPITLKLLSEFKAIDFYSNLRLLGNKNVKPMLTLVGDEFVTDSSNGIYSKEETLQILLVIYIFFTQKNATKFPHLINLLAALPETFDDIVLSNRMASFFSILIPNNVTEKEYNNMIRGNSLSNLFHSLKKGFMNKFIRLIDFSEKLRDIPIILVQIACLLLLKQVSGENNGEHFSKLMETYFHELILPLITCKSKWFLGVGLEGKGALFLSCLLILWVDPKNKDILKESFESRLKSVWQKRNNEIEGSCKISEFDIKLLGEISFLNRSEFSQAFSGLFDLAIETDTARLFLKNPVQSYSFIKVKSSDSLLNALVLALISQIKGCFMEKYNDSLNPEVNKAVLTSPRLCCFILTSLLDFAPALIPSVLKHEISFQASEIEGTILEQIYSIEQKTITFLDFLIDISPYANEDFFSFFWVVSHRDYNFQLNPEGKSLGSSVYLVKYTFSKIMEYILIISSEANLTADLNRFLKYWGYMNFAFEILFQSEGILNKEDEYNYTLKLLKFAHDALIKVLQLWKNKFISFEAVQILVKDTNILNIFSFLMKKQISFIWQEANVADELIKSKILKSYFNSPEVRDKLGVKTVPLSSLSCIEIDFVVPDLLLKEPVMLSQLPISGGKIPIVITWKDIMLKSKPNALKEFEFIKYTQNNKSNIFSERFKTLSLTLFQKEEKSQKFINFPTVVDTDYDTLSYFGQAFENVIFNHIVTIAEEVNPTQINLRYPNENSPKQSFEETGGCVLKSRINSQEYNEKYSNLDHFLQEAKLKTKPEKSQDKKNTTELHILNKKRFGKNFNLYDECLEIDGSPLEEHELKIPDVGDQNVGPKTFNCKLTGEIQTLHIQRMENPEYHASDEVPGLGEFQEAYTGPNKTEGVYSKEYGVEFLEERKAIESYKEAEKGEVEENEVGDEEGDEDVFSGGNGVGDLEKKSEDLPQAKVESVEENLTESEEVNLEKKNVEGIEVGIKKSLEQETEPEDLKIPGRINSKEGSSEEGGINACNREEIINIKSEKIDATNEANEEGKSNSDKGGIDLASAEFEEENLYSYNKCKKEVLPTPCGLFENSTPPLKDDHKAMEIEEEGSRLEHEPSRSEDESDRTSRESDVNEQVLDVSVESESLRRIKMPEIKANLPLQLWSLCEKEAKDLTDKHGRRKQYSNLSKGILLELRERKLLDAIRETSSLKDLSKHLKLLFESEETSELMCIWKTIKLRTKNMLSICFDEELEALLPNEIANEIKRERGKFLNRQQEESDEIYEEEEEEEGEVEKVIEKLDLDQDDFEKVSEQESNQQAEEKEIESVKKIWDILFNSDRPTCFVEKELLEFILQIICRSSQANKFDSNSSWQDVFYQLSENPLTALNLLFGLLKISCDEQSGFNSGSVISGLHTLIVQRKLKDILRNCRYDREHESILFPDTGMEFSAKGESKYLISTPEIKSNLLELITNSSAINSNYPEKLEFDLLIEIMNELQSNSKALSQNASEAEQPQGFIMGRKFLHNLAFQNIRNESNLFNFYELRNIKWLLSNVTNLSNYISEAFKIYGQTISLHFDALDDIYELLVEINQGKGDYLEMRERNDKMLSFLRGEIIIESTKICVSRSDFFCINFADDLKIFHEKFQMNSNKLIILGQNFYKIIKELKESGLFEEAAELLRRTWAPLEQTVINSIKKDLEQDKTLLKAIEKAFICIKKVKLLKNEQIYINILESYTGLMRKILVFLDHLLERDATDTSDLEREECGLGLPALARMMTKDPSESAQIIRKDSFQATCETIINGSISEISQFLKKHISMAEITGAYEEDNKEEDPTSLKAKIENIRKTSLVKYNGKYSSTLDLIIERSDVWNSTLLTLNGISLNDFIYKDNDNFSVIFFKEEGYDGGGLRREWLSLISKQIFDPKFGLFRASANGFTYQPSPLSSLIPNFRTHFRWVGRFIGKSILTPGFELKANFTSSFIKHMLGKPIYIKDLENVDLDLGKSMHWVLENDVDELQLNFTYQLDVLGQKIVIELKENGALIPLTNTNKKEYVKLLCYAKMAAEIKDQTEAFLKGLFEVIDQKSFKMLTEKELGLFLAGSETIDIDEMKNFALVDEGIAETAKILWAVLQESDNEFRSNFLFFVTGSYRVPLEGFVNFQLSIQKAEENSLPVAHTCGLQLDLPPYKLKEVLREKLKYAVEEGVGDGKLIARPSISNFIKVWEPDSEKCLQTIENDEGLVMSICFSPDGKKIAYLSNQVPENIAKVWVGQKFWQ